MKCGNRQICLGLAVMAGLSVAVVGCSTHHSESNVAVERRVAAVDTITDVRGDLSRADYQISATQQALHRLAEQQTGDLRPSYDAFVDGISKNRSIHESLGSQSMDLANATSAQLNTWDARAHTIQIDALRKESLDREQQAREERLRAMTPLNDLRDSYTQYIRYMEDLAAYAASDLTPRGVAGLRDHLQKVDQMAGDLRNRIAQADTGLVQLAQSWRTWRTERPVAAGPTTNESGRPAGSVMPPADRTVPPVETPANTPSRTNGSGI